MRRNGENKNQFVKADDERPPPERVGGDDESYEFDWFLHLGCSLDLIEDWCADEPF